MRHSRRDFMKNMGLGMMSLPLIRKAFSMSEPDFLKGVRKIVFLGDSITFQGGYVNVVENFLLSLFPDQQFEVVSLGLSSETVSGLSEAEHPFPRPYVMDRFQKVLGQTQPDLLIAAYGINCGIYHPFTRTYFARYQEGIAQVLKAARQQGFKLTLLTPAPYTAPVEDGSEVTDTSNAEYSYAQPYTQYDEVMAKYGEWLLGIKQKDVITVDIQSPLRQFSSLCYQGDYIHPNHFGHQLIAGAVLKAWNLGEKINEVSLTFGRDRAKKGDVSDLRFATADTHFVWRTSPPVYYEAAQQEQYNRELLPCFYIKQLKEKALPSGNYTVVAEGEELGSFTHQSLAEGVRLGVGPGVAEHTWFQAARQLYDLVARKRQVYDYALLNHIGHQRPVDRQPLPMSEAEQVKASIDQQIQELIHSTRFSFDIRKV